MPVSGRRSGSIQQRFLRTFVTEVLANLSQLTFNV